MYFPYLRGRQYELLALRELVDAHRLGEHSIPIIEPVKLSSTFIKALDLFVQNKKKIAVIHNPQVGSFSTDLKSKKKNVDREKYEELLKSRSIITAHIINTVN
ncbi:MAG TPA: sce7725 family protein [Spirochaetia bacterium]|nr:sce7725 family protein [Spirochaetia bacterium]